MAERQLYILRHAKSSWDDPVLEDHDRPLGPRGRAAVKLLAAHLREAGIHPAQVLCSSARRTVETLDGVEPGGEVSIEPDLYAASCATVIERLRQIPSETPSVMIIGHNPAMQMLVLRLASGDSALQSGPRSGGRRELSDVQRKFPTGALATLGFDCAWSELDTGCARLLAYVRPKSLG